MKITCSVIIASYNSSQTLGRCVDSVLQQRTRCELIIIDGGSSDGTAQLVMSYGNKVTFFLSEADTGVYDAWNKALKIATGDWIVFIGSDDYFNKLSAIETALNYANSALKRGIRVVYPLVSCVDAQGREIRQENEPWERARYKFPMEMPFTHVGTFHHASLFKEYGHFDSKFRIAGDYEFMLRVLQRENAEFSPEYIINMGVGGLSKNKDFMLLVLKEKRKAREKNQINVNRWFQFYENLKLIYYRLINNKL